MKPRNIPCLLFAIIFMAMGCLSQGYAQDSVYRDPCVLVRDLLHAADTSFFNFRPIAHDSTVIVLDINGVLTACGLDTTAGIPITVISSGTAIDQVKKYGIFSIDTSQKNLFLFTQELLEGITGFRVFRPATGADFYWGFKKKRHTYYLKKKGSGHF